MCCSAPVAPVRRNLYFVLQVGLAGGQLLGGASCMSSEILAWDNGISLEDAAVAITISAELGLDPPGQDVLPRVPHAERPILRLKGLKANEAAERADHGRACVVTARGRQRLACGHARATGLLTGTAHAAAELAKEFLRGVPPGADRRARSRHQRYASCEQQRPETLAQATSKSPRLISNRRPSLT